MKGFQIVSTFYDWKVRAELGEDIFKLEEDGDQVMTHEIKVYVGGSGPLILLSVDEADSVVEVLNKAIRRANERAEQFSHEAVPA